MVAMQELLDEAMREGALGLSTMLASPRELAVTTDDVVELCRVVKRHGGIYSSHIRNEGTEVLDAVKEAISIGRRAGVPVDIIHLKIAEQTLWGRMPEIIALIDQARRDGVNVQANVYPYTRGNNDLASIIPPWAHEGGTARLIERLKDPSLRDRLKRDIRNGLPGWYNHYTAVGGDWSRMLVSARLGAANQAFVGQTMDRIIAAKSKGRNPAPDPLDVLFEFLIEENGTIGTIYAHHTESDMNLALRAPWCSVGSDGYALATEGPLRRGHPHPQQLRHISSNPGRVRPRAKTPRPRRRRAQDDIPECGQGRALRPRPAPHRTLCGCDRLRPQGRDRSVYLPRAVSVQHGHRPRGGERPTGGRRWPSDRPPAGPRAATWQMTTAPEDAVPQRRGSDRSRLSRHTQHRVRCCFTMPIGLMKQKNRPENGIRTTTSPLVVQNPADWPVSSGKLKMCLSHLEPLIERGRAGGRARLPARPLAVNRSRVCETAVASGVDSCDVSAAGFVWLRLFAGPP